MGGMGVKDPVEAFITSRAYTDVIVTAIKAKGDFSVYDHLQQMTQAKKEMKHEITGFQEDKLTLILTSMSEGKKRAIQRVVKGKTSTWLTVLPVSHYHFDLSPSEFRDALAIRYHQPLTKLPADCDGCGRESTLQHALDCRKGGLIIQRHNEVRDALGDLASIAFRDVIREPIVRDADPVRGLPASVADLGVIGLWVDQTEALLDILVMDTDAQSYTSRTVDSVLLSAENEKKKKYLDAVEARHASFTPFVTSIDGVLAREANSVIHVKLLDIEVGKPLSEVTGWVRATLAFAILRATNMCIRGSKVKWRSAVDIDDRWGWTSL